jgi:uncharacterized YccA/Bax inhibitor family protein
MRSSNPILKPEVFSQAGAYASSDAMTVQGTIDKTFVLLCLLVVGAGLVWGQPLKFLPWAMPAAIIGFILALITTFKRDWAPVTAPLYAFAEGIVVGWISSLMEQQFPGIVVQAVLLTFGTLFSLLVLYRSGIIKVTQQFRMMIVGATMAIVLVYLVSMVMGMFGKTIPLINEAGPVGIIFSLIVVGVAALNLVLDFDFIEQGSKMNAPRYMEWYAGFGIMVTLIWLYLEILRLLAKLRSRR